MTEMQSKTQVYQTFHYLTKQPYQLHLYDNAEKIEISQYLEAK